MPYPGKPRWNVIAILEAGRAGLLAPRNWVRNVVAGVIVGVVALPLAMAFAIASGVKPEQGIYTAIIAGLIVSLFGGSRLQIAGPTGAFVVVLSGIVGTYGLAGLQLATLMAGLLLVLMGVFRMGAIIRFIPAPVILGFTAGIAVVIWVGQWPSFFGLDAPEGEHFHQKLPHLIESLPHLHRATTLLALLGLALLILVPRLRALRRVPAPLVAMTVITLLQVVFHFDGVATIGTAFGGIPQGLPSYTPPEISLDLIISLLGPAFTIAMLGAIESLLSAVVADGMTGTRHNSNQELIGQGVANAASALLGGIAATGALARTATNVRNGGNSPIAGLTHVAVLVAIVLVLAPLAADVPLAVLAAILFIVAWNMGEALHVIRMIRRAPRADVAILISTFLLTVLADLVIAVSVGVLLATLQFLRRMSSSVTVDQEIESTGASGGMGQADATPPLPSGILTFTIDGPFFFAAVDAFEQALAQTHTDPRVLIIRLNRVPFIDITGLHSLEDMIEDVTSRGVGVILCEANITVKRKLERADLLQMLGEGNYRDTLTGARTQAMSLVRDENPLATETGDPVRDPVMIR